MSTTKTEAIAAIKDIKMEKTIKKDGWEFEYNEEDKQYSCRGEVMYDEEHDETPEPSLWKAACEITRELNKKGINAEPEHSEKGWVEIYILD